MTGKICPSCESENSEDAIFCVSCGKDLKETIAYFKADNGINDIEIIPNALIVYKRSRWNRKRTGEVEVYERDKMENIEIGKILSQLRFNYNGKGKIYNLQRKDLKKAEEIFLPIKEKRKEGILCPNCEFTNPEDVSVCTNCGKNLEETIAYFEATAGGHDIEITPTTLIVYKRKDSKRTGEVEVYERDKMENIEIGKTLSQLRFNYNGKRKNYNLQRKYLDKAEKILLSTKIQREKELINLAKKWNVWTFGHKHDIRALPEILGDDEKVERMATGYYEGGIGVIVATDQRVLFVDKGILFGLRVEEFPYDMITSVKYKKGLMLGSITIYSGGNKAKIERVSPKEIYAFKKIIESKIIQKTKTTDQITESTTSPLDEIKKAKELLDMGAITEEEFEKIKRKLLK